MLGMVSDLLMTSQFLIGRHPSVLSFALLFTELPLRQVIYAFALVSEFARLGSANRNRAVFERAVAASTHTFTSFWTLFIRSARHALLWALPVVSANISCSFACFAFIIPLRFHPVLNMYVILTFFQQIRVAAFWRARARSSSALPRRHPVLMVEAHLAELPACSGLATHRVRAARVLQRAAARTHSLVGRCFHRQVVMLTQL
jgi:hypothetical protein